MKLFDAHNHLQDPRFDPDRDAVCQEAEAVGIAAMVVNGATEADWPRVAALAERHAAVIPSFGLHPWWIAERSAGWRADLARRLAEGNCAIGEIGLDHAVADRDEADQEAVFLDQLRLSREAEAPVSIHCRRAWGRLLELLRPLGPHPAGMILHSYGGGAGLVPELAALQAYFSYSGSLTLPGNKRTPKALRATPPDRLLLETDAPDIPPAEVRERADGSPARCEPSHLRFTLRAAAHHLRTSEADVARLTWDNGMRLFGGFMG